MSARHTMAIGPDVQAVLRESRIEADRVVLPERQLERKLYAQVIKVLAEFGGKWSRGAGAILIKATDREKLEAALGTGVVQREKVMRQAFMTPPAVASRLVAYADLALDDCEGGGPIRILEPSAGAGALIRAALAHYATCSVAITAVELDTEAAAELGRALGALVNVVQSDFLRCEPLLGDAPGYDLVVLNPPYQRAQAVRHVQHALRFLRPGGVLGAIVPLNFPDKLDGVVFESEELGAGAFKESGTGIATKMIRCVR